MPSYELIDQFHLLPTPAGAFQAVTATNAGPIEKLLIKLLKQPVSTRVDLVTLCSLLEIDNEQDALAQLYTAQSSKWLQGFKKPQGLPGAGIGEKLTDLVAKLSDLKKGLLVDGNGFPLVRAGLDEETTETLAALSADLAAVQQRHANRLQEQLGMPPQGWAIVNPSGASRIGVWPLKIGEQTFLLSLLGEPRLNQSAFITLIWMLMNRYG
ncbi:MAG: roadblock/LC7 domain-containing protein [Thiotrichales bacterium]